VILPGSAWKTIGRGRPFAGDAGDGGMGIGRLEGGIASSNVSPAVGFGGADADRMGWEGEGGMGGLVPGIVGEGKSISDGYRGG